MEQLNTGALNTDSIAELGTASDAGTESPTAQNTQTDNIQEENLSENLSPKNSEQPAKEAKTTPESDPDVELLNALKDPNIPIGKVKRFQELIKQRNELRQQLESRSMEKPEASSNQRKASEEKIDISKYSNDVREMRKQLPEIEIPQLFEYEKDETGEVINYRNPSDRPQTVEDMIKVMYPVIEENIIARMGMMGEIKQKQIDSINQESQASTQALKQDIMESFDDDNDYKDYAKVLEEDIKEWRDLHPNSVMDIRGHLFNYLKHTYKKAPEVEKQNLATAQKVGTSSTRTPKKALNTRDYDINDIANM